MPFLPEYEFYHGAHEGQGAIRRLPILPEFEIRLPILPEFEFSPWSGMERHGGINAKVVEQEKGIADSAGIRDSVADSAGIRDSPRRLLSARRLPILPRIQLSLFGWEGAWGGAGAAAGASVACEKRDVAGQGRAEAVRSLEAGSRGGGADTLICLEITPRKA